MDFKISSLGSLEQNQNAGSFEVSLDLQPQTFAGSLEDRDDYVISTPYHRQFNDSGYQSGGQQDGDDATSGKRKYRFFDIEDEFESSFIFKSPEKRFRKDIADPLQSKYLSKLQDDFASDLQVYDFLSLEQFLPVLSPPHLPKASIKQVQFSPEVNERLPSENDCEPPSIEEKKNRTAALKSTTSSAAKVVKLSPSSKPVDFITEMCIERDCRIILSSIFGYLSDKDLHSVTNTCKNWRFGIANDINATERKDAYLEQKREEYDARKENIGVQQPLPKKESRPGILKCLENNYYSSQKTNKTICDSKNVPLLQVHDVPIDRRQIVRKCPVCSMPCKIKKVEIKAICERLSCQHAFCVKCFGPHTQKHVCSVLNLEETANLQSVMCTKKSRKYLRRL